MSISLTLSLLLLVIASVATVLFPSLLLAAISLGATSAVLAVIIYQMGAPYAAVFELSVCAGLVTVVFVSAISLTRREALEEERAIAQDHLRRFRWVPIIVSAAALSIVILSQPFTLPAIPIPDNPPEVREVLWNVRRFDIVGQALVLLAGVFGVVLLFKRQSDGAE